MYLQGKMHFMSYHVLSLIKSLLGLISGELKISFQMCLSNGSLVGFQVKNYPRLHLYTVKGHLLNVHNFLI